MKESIKVRDAVSQGDFLKAWAGKTSVVVSMKSDAFEVETDRGLDVVKSSVVLRKDQVAKLHRYLGKVLDQMEDRE